MRAKSKGVILAIHSKSELITLINSMSEQRFIDGVILLEPKRQARERIKNPQKVFKMQCDEAVTKRLETQRDRYFEHVGNKTVATDILAKVWELISTETIERMAADEQIETGSLGDA